MQSELVDAALDVPFVFRERLIGAIQEAPEQIVLVQGAAGMGKSVLLSQLARRTGCRVHESSEFPRARPEARFVFWDAGDPKALETLSERTDLPQKLVVAVRPNANRALARLAFYGKLRQIDAHDLLFSRDELVATWGARRADFLLQQAGGWPALTAYCLRHRDGDVDMEAFFGHEILPNLPAPELVAIGLLLEGTLPADIDTAALVPLIDPEPGVLRIADFVDRSALWGAWQRETGARIDSISGAMQLADAHLHHGDVTAAINTLQHGGHFDRALDLFSRSGGLFYIYRHGAEAYDRVLAGFRPSFTNEHEILVVSRAMQALKRGELGRARRVMTEYLGAVAANPTAVLTNPANYSLQMRFFRIMMVIYEDRILTDDLLDQVFRVIDELPIDSDLERGCLYNCVLEFYMRRRRFVQAEDMAERARQHYERADAQLLQFYINLHRAIMRLMFGDVIKATHFAEDARRNLAAAAFDSPGDTRMLALVDACIAFEGGKTTPLIHFLDVELDGFSHGELWPSLAEFALHYGSQALNEHFSPAAARSFLDRWRVFQFQNRQFQTIIEIREAINLQNANRWHEAAQKLSEIPLRITRSFVQRTTGELERLEDRDEIYMALAWLRHLVFEAPQTPELDRKIEAMLDNLYLTGRQTFSAQIWLAYVHRAQRNTTKARSQLQKTLEDAGRLGALAPLAEERFFLNELIGNQRMAEFLSTSGAVRQVLRRLGDLGVSAKAAENQSGLTKREFRILLLISEGGSNKYIAHTLGLSEATVKFHLGNAYKKLGCSNRREAISAAKSIGLIG